MATIIIKLEHSNLLQHSREGVKIQKIVSSISPLTFIKLLFKADTKVNPRTATVNPITKSIYETLDKSPELFWYKPQIRSESVCSNQFNCYACVRHQIEANDALVMPL